jgi:hypothetical protein
MRRILKEVWIFFIMFLILGLGMHMEKWLSSPIAHFEQLPNHVMPWHPLIYTALFYVAIGGLRVIFIGIKRLFTRS